MVRDQKHGQASTVHFTRDLRIYVHIFTPCESCLNTMELADQNLAEAQEN
jgi:hypothetical protein